MFHRHGIPADIVSDQGPQFVSPVYKALCLALRASSSLSSGFHPSPMVTERANQDLEAALRSVAAKDPGEWAVYLSWVEYADNSLTTSATGRAPFEVALGYQPPLFPDQERELVVPTVQAHFLHCCRICRETREALLRSVEATKRCYPVLHSLCRYTRRRWRG